MIFIEYFGIHSLSKEGGDRIKVELQIRRWIWFSRFYILIVYAVNSPYYTDERMENLITPLGQTKRLVCELSSIEMAFSTTQLLGLALGLLLTPSFDCLASSIKEGSQCIPPSILHTLLHFLIVDSSKLLILSVLFFLDFLE